MKAHVLIDARRVLDRCKEKGISHGDISEDAGYSRTYLTSMLLQGGPRVGLPEGVCKIRKSVAKEFEYRLGEDFTYKPTTAAAPVEDPEGYNVDAIQEKLTVLGEMLADLQAQMESAHDKLDAILGAWE